MTDPDHYRGFEKEVALCRLLRTSLAECPGLKLGTLCKIIRQVAPDLMGGLFDARPYARKLRYVGYRHMDEPIHFPGVHFAPGHIYESVDFNGGTYSIKGYEGRRFGCAFFEMVNVNLPANAKHEPYGGEHER